VRRNEACSGAIGNSLHIAGGYTTGLTATTEAFKLKTNSWKLLANMP
jgi:hypothetical protein